AAGTVQGTTGRSAAGPGPLPPGGSGRNPTPAWYGLNRTGAVRCDRLRDQPIPSAGVLVGRKGGIHLVDPGQHAAADMDRIGKSGVLYHGQAFGAARAALAMQHDPLVLRQGLEGGAREELSLGNQHPARNGDDLVLVRLADVHQEDFLLAVKHVLELSSGDGRPGRRLLRVLRDRAAELLVVDQLGDRGVLAADRALRILPDPDRPVG